MSPIAFKNFLRDMFNLYDISSSRRPFGIPKLPLASVVMVNEPPFLSLTSMVTSFTGLPFLVLTTVPETTNCLVHSVTYQMSCSPRVPLRFDTTNPLCVLSPGTQRNAISSPSELIGLNIFSTSPIGCPRSSNFTR